MKLRILEKKDIPLMLEWMHDEESLQYFRFDTVHMTEEKAAAFIENSQTEENRHYAVAGDADEYLGTISLKQIDRDSGSAEYAVVLRKCARGNGTAADAADALMRLAFGELGLNRIYLNVYRDNARAIRFYEKLGFVRFGETERIRDAAGEEKELIWYEFRKEDFVDSRFCYLCSFAERGDARGQLVALEGGMDVPFEIRRLFYIYGTEENIARGNHANRKSSFLFVCLNGSVKIELDDGSRRDTVVLEQKNRALVMPAMIWKRMYDFSRDAVLLVLSDAHYDAEEYIKDYEEFIREINQMRGSARQRGK